MVMRWIPKGEGSYCRPSNGRPFIVWCPFDREAIPILFHEFGHHVDHKHHRTDREIVGIEKNYMPISNIIFYQKNIKNSERTVFDVIYSEANASRFAIAAMKSMGLYKPPMRQYLWKAFNTYIECVYGAINTKEEKLAFTNLINSCSMKILN